MREHPFHRVRRLPPYVFGEVNAMKAEARAAGRDIIDLGMGNPDQPTPAPIVAKLTEAAKNPRAHRYSMSRGIPGLRRAQARYYARRFGVDLDPETEGLCAAGWQVPSPPATTFVWVPVPERLREPGSLAFSKLLLQEANVATSPGIGFGEYGEDHVRLALVENRHRLRQAVRNIKAFLTRHGTVAEPSGARAVA
jgi:aspartate/methionine/tyrosine aminotransferase